MQTQTSARKPARRLRGGSGRPLPQLLEVLECRILLSGTDTWLGGQGDWGLGEFWSAGAPPGPGDTAVFPFQSLAPGLVPRVLISSDSGPTSATKIVVQGDYVFELVNYRNANAPFTVGTLEVDAASSGGQVVPGTLTLMGAGGYGAYMSATSVVVASGPFLQKLRVN